jgi:2-polyprenyl-6-methoxyphenol hydroxylase-like FAD-dependent oxidoreductase
MLGYLLARAGIGVVVLEKHGDFLRDFRGDTIHPSTLEVMHELGLLDEFLTLPHSEVRSVSAQFGDTKLDIGDFSHLPTHCHFIAFMPQWDFLDFLSRHGSAFKGFDLRMNTEVIGLVEEAGRVVGLRAKGRDGAFEIRADLVIAADGRHSTIRAASGLAVTDIGAPIDVLWMRLPRSPSDGAAVLGYFGSGRVLVTLDRGDYWQCAFVIPKGGYDKVRAAGLAKLRDDIARLVPMLADRLGALDGWDKIKLLTVAVDRLPRWWRDGLLCIGDAAHAMSPVGGVGINLAVADAVAAANILNGPLRERRLTTKDLAAVQVRREWPMRVIQAMQVYVQDRIVNAALRGGGPPKPPWPLRLLTRFPVLQRLPARTVGLGIRMERVHSPALTALRRAP